ncbi:hypothetical protein BJ322DRAFT_1024456 [Thelephora terrestris]|uniref:Uncharacterized protein n=1 Tax=Thelephora terrestris TaxID=56493 RepID=A0A9P6L1U7_9AGAM|nr:hypothetical protein BJ322DRAFT_1024456 [Thelephora terrestris]
MLVVKADSLGSRDVGWESSAPPMPAKQTRRPACQPSPPALPAQAEAPPPLGTTGYYWWPLRRRDHRLSHLSPSLPPTQEVVMLTVTFNGNLKATLDHIVNGTFRPEVQSLLWVPEVFRFFFVLPAPELLAFEPSESSLQPVVCIVSPASHHLYHTGHPQPFANTIMPLRFDPTMASERTPPSLGGNTPSASFHNLPNVFQCPQPSQSNQDLLE